MKILAIYRHYSPDAAPYARILQTILEHFAACGHDTTVVTSQPCYNNVRQPPQPWQETLGGVNVRRVRLLPERKQLRVVRLLNFVYFLLRAVMHAVFARRYDLIVANTHPPVLMGCALRIIQRFSGTPYIYHCQDIHPEAAALARDLKRNWFYRALLRLDTATCKRAQRVVVLSQDMADTLAARGVSRANIVIINNLPLATSTPPSAKLPPPLDTASDAVRFLFAGNLGRFQGLERVVAAARLVAGRVPFELIFMGEGSAKGELMSLAGDLLGRRIVFIPQQPPETAHAAMRLCDYGVVSLMSDVFRFAYPSKSIVYLAAGCPLVSVVEPESELARTIAHCDLGYVPEARSVTSIAETIVKAVVERGRWSPAERHRIEDTCHELFGQQQMLVSWDRVIAGQPVTPAVNLENEQRSMAA